ncbi:MAG: Lrp/AsnC family transcriptional regulator [Luteibaculaceae bacterium]
MPQKQEHIFDSIDVEILNTLQENSRTTNVQLSQMVGLSPASTLERVRKLEKIGAIKGYHAVLDNAVVDLGFTGFIQVTLTRQARKHIQEFTDKILQIEEIVACYQLTGGFDYLLKVVTQDIPSFERLVNNTLSQIEEIGHMHTLVSLAEVKQEKRFPLKHLLE